VDVAIEVQTGLADAGDVRSLRQWMVADEMLRGRVRVSTAPPDHGTLGGVVETLTVALGPGGVATALASVLISWIRRRTGNVSVKISKPDGASYEFSATNIRSLSGVELQEVTAKLARHLDGEVS